MSLKYDKFSRACMYTVTYGRTNLRAANVQLFCLLPSNYQWLLVLVLLFLVLIYKSKHTKSQVVNDTCLGADFVRPKGLKPPIFWPCHQRPL